MNSNARAKGYTRHYPTGSNAPPEGAQRDSTTAPLNCPTCGAPVDYFDEQVIRGTERRGYRSYHYQQPAPVDMREIRLEAIEQFVRLVRLEDGDPVQALDTVLETLRQQIRGHIVG